MKLLKTNLKHKILLLLLFTVALAATLLVSNNGFFWDSILLSSRYANWFYTNGLFRFILPDALDAVHPPTFGLYMAIWWKVLGRTLLVSHLAMLPFLWGIIWQLYRLAKYFFPDKFLWMALLLVIADTTLIGQCLQLSPDVALVFLFFWALNSVLYSKPLQLILSTVLLAFVSIRGMFGVLSIVACHLYVNRNSYATDGFIKYILKTIRYYIPAGLLVLIFLAWHYSVKGWVLPQNDSRWAEHYNTAGAKVIIYNILILGWRMVDFGRIFLWLPLPFIFWWWYRKKPQIDPHIKTLCWFFILFIITNAPYLLFFRQPIGHRYLIPAYLLFAFWIFSLLVNMEMPVRVRSIAYGMMLAGLISGNFWIYPEGMAKGWDSTPAHLPYYELRAQMIGYVQENNIPISSVGSDFPNNSLFDDIDLNRSAEAFPEKDLQNQEYIFYSNIFNGFSDQQIIELKKSWLVVKEYRKAGVFVRLYNKRGKATLQ